MFNFKNSKWIWIDKKGEFNQYGEFYKEFDYSSGKFDVKISCDSDYTLYINGKFVDSNQYGDFEHYKIYDTIDITPYLKKGKNSIAVLVWHFGKDTQRYLLAKAGLIFAIQNENGEDVVVSDETVQSRITKAYQCGEMRIVTLQLGVGFNYDANKEDDWVNGNGEGFKNSFIIDKNCTFYPRPNNKLKLLPFRKGKLISNENNTHFIFDIGEEIVGLVSFKFDTENAQKILVSYGEDLQNGHVRRLIGGRDFSVDYIAKPGANDYTNYMFRFGCRYLEIETEEPISNFEFGIIPQIYETKAKKVVLENELDSRIYNICLRSIELCMMEHYVDCPWREQALYCFDSRNQMLCGYYAFEDGNYNYVRSNLKLMAMDRRADKMLAICFPCGVDLTIPSFALHWFSQMKEYLEYSKDATLAEESFDKMLEVLNLFASNSKDGLINAFKGACYWNFYDWTASCAATIGPNTEDQVPDLFINSLFVIALNCFEYICNKIGKEFTFGALRNEIIERANKYFFNEEKGLFTMYKDREIFTVLGNSLAIISGIANEKQAKYICTMFSDPIMEDCSLSMKSFKYDALLKVDFDKYKDVVLSEIRNDYTIMLNNDATSTWETIDGALAFENAGSLCHGWTGIPIYYYNKFGLIK